MTESARGLWIGISGYDYKPWRGTFYPAGLPANRWLRYASEKFNSIELNGTFYSLKSPSVFQRWIDATPSDGFVFAIKGGRFITHNLKLRNCDAAMGNFFASGILLLGRKTGPFLWQLPATYSFDAERMSAFMQSLPRSSREAEAIAENHDERLRRGDCVRAVEDVPYRHAFEVRHPSYFNDEFYEILRTNKCALVIADSAGRFPSEDVMTADFIYVRLHGPRIMYASGYDDRDLDEWAVKIRKWRGRGKAKRDAYVYFDNDVKTYAPRDALELMARLGSTH